MPTRRKSGATMSDPRDTYSYRQAVKKLKARAPEQQCWSCGKWLYAELKYPHPLSITLGHYVALEDGGHLTHPSNHGAQCVACNMGDGARRTNNKRSGRNGNSYSNDAW